MKVNWYAAATEFNSEVKLSLVSEQKGQKIQTRAHRWAKRSLLFPFLL